MVQYAIVAAALGAATYYQVKAADPTMSRFWLVVVVVAIALGGPIDGALRAWADFRGTVSWTFRLKVEVPVKTLLVTLDEKTSATWKQIGITVFIVRHSRRHPFGVQERIFRLRMKTKPKPTRIGWTRHKKPLGECWRTREPVEFNHTTHRAKVEAGRHGQPFKWWEWLKVPRADRLGLRCRDYNEIRSFGYVVAMPIIPDGGHFPGRYRGCLVVQVNPRFEGDFAEGTEGRQAMELAAETIANLLP